MMNENKDEQLKSAFEGYFDGGELPEVDLARAKAELGNRRARRKRGKRISAVLSACAAFALVLAFCFTVLPALMPAGAGNDMAQSPASPDDPNYGANVPQNPSDLPNPDGDITDEAGNSSYSLSDAYVRTVSYAELRESFGQYALDFARAETDDAAECRYSVYTYKGNKVLLRAEITATGDVPFTATVYADLSNGKYSAEELAPYKRLPQEEGYRAQTQNDGGVYLSKAFWKKNGDMFADVRSSSELGLQTLLAYFL